MDIRVQGLKRRSEQQSQGAGPHRTHLLDLRAATWPETAQPGLSVWGTLCTVAGSSVGPVPQLLTEHKR